jgi:hypothetical protein
MKSRGGFTFESLKEFNMEQPFSMRKFQRLKSKLRREGLVNVVR